MISSHSQDAIERIRATDHLDPDGSVVHSGMLLADAVLEVLEKAGGVEVDLKGVKGASSSYFNVFLRRIEEGCGLAALDRHIHIEFGSKIQEMIYTRSLESVKRGPPIPPAGLGDTAGDATGLKRPKRWLARLAFWKWTTK